MYLVNELYASNQLECACENPCRCVTSIPTAISGDTMTMKSSERCDVMFLTFESCCSELHYSPRVSHSKWPAKTYAVKTRSVVIMLNYSKTEF